MIKYDEVSNPHRWLQSFTRQKAATYTLPFSYIQDTLAKVRAATSHLKHLKIAVMGCIVNGPGEMADADYGYVGSGKGRVSLYRHKEIVKKNVAEQDAVRELVDLIKESGDWYD